MPHRHPLNDVQATFAAKSREPLVRYHLEPDVDRHRPGAKRGSAADPGDELLGWVQEATAVSHPEATITVRRASGYLRVRNPLPGGGWEQWPVGVVDRDLTAAGLDAFITQVHARFAAADPQVRSELVYGGGLADEGLVD